MTKNAKARRLLGLDHWQSNTQKVALLTPTYRRVRNNPHRTWRVLRTKASFFCYGDI